MSGNPPADTDRGAITPYSFDEPRSLFDSFDRMRNSMLKPFYSWDPLHNFDAFWDEGPMRSLVQNARAVAGTKVDWKETPDAHVIMADLPGLSKEEVKVTVEDDRMLKISGERTKETEDKSDTWHRVERSHGRFLRQFTLPENANVDAVKAKVENGVLTVTVPKLDRADTSKQRNISIQ